MIAQEKDTELKICFVAPLPPPYGGIANWMAMLFVKAMKLARKA